MNNKRLPDFFIVGAAKSGTTTLNSYLTKHPDIFMCKPKEPEFFARDDIFANGIDWYSQLFSNASPEQICGEASTIYSLWPHFPNTAKRIAQHIPNAKIVYVMRNPIDRAYSFYVQLVKNAQNSKKNLTGLTVSRTFEEFILPEKYPDRCSKEDFFANFDMHLPDDPGIVIDGSNYLKQITQYKNEFSDISIYLMFFEDFVSNPQVELENLCKFLGVDPKVDFKSTEAIAENTAKSHFRGKQRDALVAKLKSTSFGSVASKLLPRTVKDRLLDGYLESYGWMPGEKTWLPDRMKPETRDYLLDCCLDSTKAIMKMTGKNLSNWLK